MLVVQVVMTTGILYLVLSGRHLLPVREGAQGRRDVYGLREYVTEVRITAWPVMAGSRFYR